MAISGGCLTVLLTEEHLRKIIEYNLLKEDEISDPVKLSRVVRKSLDAALGLPDLPWHDWDEWGKGLTCPPLRRVRHAMIGMPEF